MKRFLSVCVLLLLTACASTTGGQHQAAQQIVDGKFVPTPGNGVVVMSMTMQSLDRDTSDATVFVQGAQGTSHLYARILTDMINAPGSDSSPSGRVYMLSLPAGDYVVSHVAGSWSRRSDSMLAFDSSEYFNVPVQQKFTVRAGEVSYLGSLNLTINFQSSVGFNNEFKRDMFDLQKRYSLTDVSNIQQHILGGK